MSVISPNARFLAAHADLAIEYVARARRRVCPTPSTTRHRQPQTPELLATLAPSTRELVQ